MHFDQDAMDQTLTSNRVSAAAIASFIAEALAKMGLPPPDAAKVAELMLEADLTGADGHGIFRLPQYVRRLKASGFNKRPNITVTRTAPATPPAGPDSTRTRGARSADANSASPPLDCMQ